MEITMNLYYSGVGGRARMFVEDSWKKWKAPGLQMQSEMRTGT